MQINSSTNSPFYMSSVGKKEDPKQTQEEKTLNSTQENEEEKSEKTQKVNGKDLSESEVRQVRELEKIDREVRAHEAAHMAAGGGLAGAASYGYTRGPDNKMYAVSGEVPIRMQKGNTPEETIANAMQVIAAAMAPADPSPQDYKVAANAMQMQNEARMEQSKIKAEELKAQNEKNKEENKEENKDNKTNPKAVKAYKETINQVENSYDKST